MNLHRAVRANLEYIPLWKNALPQIYPVLGFTDSCPTEYAFADAVAKWQRSSLPPLAVDGMLGPVSWQRMKRDLGIVRIASVPDDAVENWGPQCFGPAQPGTIPIDAALLARNRMVEHTLFTMPRNFITPVIFVGFLL